MYECECECEYNEDIDFDKNKKNSKNRNVVSKKRKYGDAFDPLTFEFMRFGDLVGDKYVFKLKDYVLHIPVEEKVGICENEEVEEGIKMIIEEKDDDDVDNVCQKMNENMSLLGGLIEPTCNFNEDRKRPETIY